MKTLEKFKNFLFKKRPLVSLICSSVEQFYVLEEALKTNKSIGSVNITFRYKEADIIIISGFYTPDELKFIENIINEISSKCKIFVYGKSNLMLNAPNIKGVFDIETLYSLIRSLTYV